MAIKQFLSKAKKLQEQQNLPRKVIDQRNEHATHDESNWLVSYADMMTLLCAFFIMLFSMAKLDDRKYEQVKESIASKFGGTYQSPVDNTAKFVTQMIQEMGLDRKAVIRSDASGVAVTFESTLFFDTLSADIKKDGVAVLDRLIQGLSGLQAREGKRYRIVIEGHTDSRPVLSGIFPSNWELSSARAARVVRMFLDHGFTPDHMTAIGYADTYPVTEARLPSGLYDEAALARNRRVVVRIMSPAVDAIPFPEHASSRRAPASSAQLGNTPPPGPSTQTPFYLPIQGPPVGAHLPQANARANAMMPGAWEQRNRPSPSPTPASTESGESENAQATNPEPAYLTPAAPAEPVVPVPAPPPQPVVPVPRAPGER